LKVAFAIFISAIFRLSSIVTITLKSKNFYLNILLLVEVKSLQVQAKKP